MRHTINQQLVLWSANSQEDLWNHKSYKTTEWGRHPCRDRLYHLDGHIGTASLVFAAGTAGYTTFRNWCKRFAVRGNS